MKSKNVVFSLAIFFMLVLFFGTSFTHKKSTSSLSQKCESSQMVALQRIRDEVTGSHCSIVTLDNEMRQAVTCGVSIDSSVIEGKTMLYLALELSCYPGTVEYLLDQGANVSQESFSLARKKVDGFQKKFEGRVMGPLLLQQGRIHKQILDMLQQKKSD